MSKVSVDQELLGELLNYLESDASEIRQRFYQSASPIVDVRAFLPHCGDFFDSLFLGNEDIRELVALRAWLMDEVLAGLWQRYDLPTHVCLVAVGGYGRGELHPYSDIDLLILAKSPIGEELGEKLSDFITLLWDLRLDIGHSVRTLEECIESAKEDVTIATNLLETRNIVGDESILESLSKRIYSDEVYTSKAYFIAKREEQFQRHYKYSGTEYNLEPNLKSSPGTLRDIQTVTWITKRHFGPDAKSPRDRYHFLNDDEFSMLLAGETFLWKLRYGLQIIAQRAENRLLFDQQRKLAEMLGYEDRDEKLAVEQMMQTYYRTVLGLAELADVTLQYFEDYYLNPDEQETIIPLNNRFQLNNQYIETINDDVFDRSPYALIEIFLILAQNPSIKGIKATTIRHIREYHYYIDDNFRSDLANTSLFMEILRTPHKLHRTLNAMLRYNVLGRYIPEFGKIIGQMQHDLFHCFTVDAHTIKIIKNIVKLESISARKEFPLASRLLKYIPKREMLFLAALYHDIAKGRGGDHSELGAIDARAFCERHRISTRDTQLICWLVEHHLLMSMTAQKKDIADPDVIHAFASQIPSLTHLQYLYVLTVCDIEATNPSLWNSWRASLLQQLYIETRRMIRKGMDYKVDREEWILATKQEVHSLLLEQGFAKEKVDTLFSELDDEYFLQDSTAEIAWQASAILKHGDSTEPLIIINDATTSTGDGYSQIMIYLKSEEDLFAATTAVFEQLNLNVLNARVSATGGDFSLSNFIVTDAQNLPLAEDHERRKKVHEKLVEELDDPADYPEIIKRRTPRQLKHFSFPTEVTFSNDMINQNTVLEVVTPDRPGLLARIGRILLNHKITLKNARIATLGERVEDVFFLADSNGNPISDGDLCQSLSDEICKELDEHVVDSSAWLV